MSCFDPAAAKALTGDLDERAADAIAADVEDALVAFKMLFRGCFLLLRGE